MTNPCLDAVTTELDKAGIRYTVEHGGKHLKVRYGEGLHHTHIVAATPSDRRAPLNERAQIRRSLAALGYGAFDDEPVETALVALHDGEASVMSFDLAKNFSKIHRDVMRAIDNVRENCSEEFNVRHFAHIEYVDQKGRTHKAYRLTEGGFQMIAMGFTGPAAVAWKEKYIAAFEAMRAEIRRLGGSDDYVRRDEMDAMLSMFSDLEKRALPAPPKKAAFIPSSILKRRAERQSRRRHGSGQKDWRQSA